MGKAFWPIRPVLMEDDIFAAAGRALAQAHRFERNLKGLASLVHSVRTAREGDHDETSFSKLSIGPLLDAVRGLVDFDPRLPALLEEARTRRNALCHSFFEDHKADLATPEGRERALAELRESETLFDDAADFCSGALGLLVENLERSLESS